MPEPSGFVVKKGTKRLAVSSMPAPLSSTQISAVPASSCQERSTRSPCWSRRGLDGVLHQVDHGLLDLGGCRRQVSARTGPDLDLEAPLQRGGAPQERRQVEGGGLGRGQAAKRV